MATLKRCPDTNPRCVARMELPRFVSGRAFRRAVRSPQRKARLQPQPAGSNPQRLKPSFVFVAPDGIAESLPWSAVEGRCPDTNQFPQAASNSHVSQTQQGSSTALRASMGHRGAMSPGAGRASRPSPHHPQMSQKRATHSSAGTAMRRWCRRSRMSST